VLEGSVSSLTELVTSCALCHVSEVVTYHLKEESSAFSFLLSFHGVILNHVDDILAILLELTFNLFLVIAEGASEFLVLGVLFNSGDCSNGGSLTSNQILEAD